MRSIIRGNVEEDSPRAREGNAKAALAQFCSWSPDFGLMLQRGRDTHRQGAFRQTESACLDAGNASRGDS